MARWLPTGVQDALQIPAVQQLVSRPADGARKSGGRQTRQLASAVESGQKTFSPAGSQVKKQAAMKGKQVCILMLFCCFYFSHSFFTRSHNPSAMMTLPASNNKAWISGPGRVLSTNTTSTVKFLGPTRSLQPLQQNSAIHLKLASDARERQVVQSEPARPKPQWSDDEDSKKKEVNTEDDDDGFEDIFQ